MPEVHQPPTGGKGRAPSVDLADPAARRAWLADLREQLEDLAAAGEDATRPLGRRALGRPTARGQILEARHALQQLVDAAERGLGPAT
jgi:hypothetical protein